MRSRFVPMTRPEFKKYFDSMALRGEYILQMQIINQKLHYDSAA